MDVTSYAFVNVLYVVGEEVAGALESAVDDLPKVIGREVVCKDSFGRFVLLVLCRTDEVIE